MSSSKAKASGVSATSFFDLKAELSKKEAELSKAKAEGRTRSVGAVKRPEKKPTIWARQNKGVKDRAIHDIQLEEISKPTLESARSVLERKAKIYEKLRKGKTGGLSDAQYDALLVDFDSNNSTSKFYEAHSSDEDESLTVPKPSTEDDPIVEYEDEFGRMKTARRSEVPRHLMLESNEELDSDEDVVIRNPVNHFPVYQPSEERVAEVERKFSEAQNPLNVHYDASKEVRAKGAGFYQFSIDEETRRRQMEELKAAREETEKTRQTLGAEDIIPGQEEGMVAGSDLKSRAMEKRKREIEERRKLLETKRKKPKLDEELQNSGGSSLSGMDAPPSSSMPQGVPTDPFSDLESQTLPRVQEPPKTASDPLAALEESSGKSKQKGKEKVKPALTEADVFLSHLEHEFLSSRLKR